MTVPSDNFVSSSGSDGSSGGGRGTGKTDYLLSKLLAQGLTSEEQGQLSQILSADPVARQQYRNQLLIHASLQWRFGWAQGPQHGSVDPVVIAELVAEMQNAQRQMDEALEAERAAHEARESERQRELMLAAQRRARPRPIEIPRSVAYAVAASVVAAFGWMISNIDPANVSELASREPAAAEEPTEIASQSDAASLPKPVAVLQDSVLAEFIPVISDGLAGGTRRGPLPIKDGTPLYSMPYELVQGVVRLKMAGGAEVLVEAPSIIDLRSPDRIRLQQGRLVGQVTREAVGFAIEAPNATIVDLGTEFGVSVSSDRAADITLFDGELEIVASETVRTESGLEKAARRRLSNTGSIRVDSESQFADARTRPSLYFREIPTRVTLRQKAAYERWVRYGDNLASDPNVVLFYTFHDELENSPALLNVANEPDGMDGTIKGAQWSPGRWKHKQALRFASSNPNESSLNHVAVNVPGTYRQITLATWVNFDFLLEGLTSLLATEPFESEGGLHWQVFDTGHIHIGQLDKPGNGKRKTKKFRSDDALPLNSLQSWHHLATVIDCESSRVSFYIDGEPAGIDSGELPSEVFLGSIWLGNWQAPENLSQIKYQCIHGSMDEFIMLRRALDATEIRTMYEAGTVKPK